MKALRYVCIALLLANAMLYAHYVSRAFGTMPAVFAALAWFALANLAAFIKDPEEM